MADTVKVGDLYPVWWTATERDASGRPLARVFEILPYTGRYPQWFNAVLRLHAPNTRRGYADMTVQI